MCSDAALGEHIEQDEQVVNRGPGLNFATGPPYRINPALVQKPDSKDKNHISSK